MNKLHGVHSTKDLRRIIKFPESLKPINNINKIKKRSSFNKDIYNININNFNINTRREPNKNCSGKTIDLVTDFKKVLEQTESIKKRIFNNKLYIFPNFEQNEYININKKPKRKLSKNDYLINRFKRHLSPNQKNKTIELNYRTDNSFYYPESYKYTHSNKNFRNINVFQTPTINRNISLRNNFEKIVTKLKNKNLKKESDFLINESSLLRSKIKEYKNKIKNKFPENKKPINYYDENLNKFINSIKFSLNNNVNNNLELSKTIINSLKKIQELEKNIKIKLKREMHKNFLKKRIEENNKRFIKLKKEKDILSFELEKLKIYFEELKRKEKVFSVKYESELIAIQDKNDLITKLKYTIKTLNKSQEEIPKNRLNPVRNLKLNINSNDKDSNEVTQLKLILKFLENQKKILIKENKSLKNENLNSINSNYEKYNTKELKEELNKLHKEAFENKLKVEKKEKQIKILKDVINRISNALKEQNMKDDIFKLDLDKLTKEDYDDKEYINILIKNKLKTLANKRNNYQRMKNLKNFNQIKTYENIIKKKDIEISSLEDEIYHKSGILKIIEDKVKPLYKKNNMISKTSSFLNSISDNNSINAIKNYKTNINWKIKQENLYDKIRKRKSKILYMKNIDNNFKKNFVFNYNYK